MPRHIGLVPLLIVQNVQDVRHDVCRCVVVLLNRLLQLCVVHFPMFGWCVSSHVVICTLCDQVRLSWFDVWIIPSRFWRGLFSLWASGRRGSSLFVSSVVLTSVVVTSGGLFELG